MIETSLVADQLQADDERFGRLQAAVNFFVMSMQPSVGGDHQNTATPCGRASGLCRVIGTGDDDTSLRVPSSSSTAST